MLKLEIFWGDQDFDFFSMLVFNERVMKMNLGRICSVNRNDISLIVARSKNNVIGKKGKILWKIMGEQKQFKELTIKNVVIMGRKSFYG